MRVLVTGSSGFIGQWVCRTVAEKGFEVVGIDIAACQPCSEMAFYKTDILDANALSAVFHKTQPDCIVHLAARTDLDEKKDIKGYAVNTDGVHNVLQCISNSRSIRRVIVTSSQLVCSVGYIPKNDTDYRPNTLYGQSKVETENITRQLDGGGKEWCIVRPTTVWGPGMNSHYQSLLKLICQRRYFHCGSAKLFKSYSYAGNIAFQYMKILSAPAERIHGQTFYLADYEPLALQDYTNKLAESMGAPGIPTLPVFLARWLAFAGDGLNRIGLRQFPFNSFRLRNILTGYQFDLSKTREVCGDLPFSFDEGVKATAKWYLEQHPQEKAERYAP